MYDTTWHMADKMTGGTGARGEVAVKHIATRSHVLQLWDARCEAVVEQLLFLLGWRREDRTAATQTQRQRH